jgi:hypothetical protein
MEKDWPMLALLTCGNDKGPALTPMTSFWSQVDKTLYKLDAK